MNEEKKATIEAEEKQRSPERKRIRHTRCKPEEEANALDWRRRKDLMDTLDGLKKHSVLKFKHHKHRHHKHHEPIEDPKLPFRA